MAVTTGTLFRISTRELALGMFVAELDMPWLESPFMLQGFLLENDHQLRELRTLCREVVIDRSLSTGKYFKTRSSLTEIASKPRVAAINASVVLRQAAPVSVAPGSFFNMLQALRNGQSPQHALETLPTAQVTEIIHNRNNTKSGQSLPSRDAGQMVTTPASGYSSLFGRLCAWLQGLGMRPASIPERHEQSQTIAGETAGTLSDSTVLVPVEVEMAQIYPQFAETEADTRVVFEKIAQGANIDLVHVSASLERMLHSIERNPDALLWLSRLRQTDDYAYNKALYVSINMMAFGHFLSLPRAQVKELGLAGLFQDIGKIRIPADILQKPGELDEVEFTLVKQHVQASLETLQQNTDISAAVMQIVAEHHERFDGSGYPNQLQGASISLLGQIAGLMDTYCAMTTNKPYAKGMFSHEVLEALYASRNRKFSESLVDQLIQFFGIYPVSSLVELNSGEVAVVIEQNQIRRLQPKVMLLLDYNKKRIQSPMTLDLIQAPMAPNGEPYKILRGLPPDSFGLNTSDYYH